MSGEASARAGARRPAAPQQRRDARRTEQAKVWEKERHEWAARAHVPILRVEGAPPVEKEPHDRLRARQRRRGERRALALRGRMHTHARARGGASGVTEESTSEDGNDLSGAHCRAVVGIPI